MKKNINKYLVVATIVALPLATTIICARTRTHETERKELINFIEYCKTCENLRQVNPAKDFTKASYHELKSAARFYEEQENFADCTDYQQQAKIDKIIGRIYAARMINNNK